VNDLVVLILLLVLTGFLAGFTGGLLGIGGSIIMIPAMTELLGPDQHLYQAAAMIVNFFVVVPSAVQHYRAGAIDARLIGRLLPVALVCVIIGVTSSEHSWFHGVGEARLRLLFGLFLLFIAAYELYRLVRRSAPAAARDAEVQPSWRFAAAVAVPTGLVAGLLGVGGGILAVPLQRRFLGVPIRQAIANSATLIIATSLVGAAVKNYALVAYHARTLSTSLMLAGVLIPTAIVGASIGSSLTHRLHRRVVQVAFFVLLLLVAVRLTWSALRDVPRPVESGPTADAGFALPFR